MSLKIPVTPPGIDLGTVRLIIIIIIIIIITIIIIIINCNWVVTRWQWLFYMYTNMKRSN